MRHVVVGLVDRANYGRLRTFMLALREVSGIRLSVVCAGSMVLDRFGHTWQEVADDGFHVAERLYCSLEGNTPCTMASSVALATEAFTGAFRRLEPDLVVLIGDRFEAMGAAIAAAYSNRCLLHFQGGEVSGSIDESTRHAISKLAHYHVPATVRAAQNLVRMGERPDTILQIGCPVADAAADITPRRTDEVLVIYHPNALHPDTAEREMEQLLQATRQLNHVTYLWPNIDAGSDAISKAIRRAQQTAPLHVEKHIPPEQFLHRIANARLCIGNSSSFVRDAGFFGTPVVLVGDRQLGRELPANVLHVPTLTNFEIGVAIMCQFERTFPPSSLYGMPGVSHAVARQLPDLPLYTQKRLSYGQRDYRRHTSPPGLQRDSQKECRGVLW